jgi:hypothetical protein
MPSSHLKSTLAYALPLLIVGLVMLPRLTSAHFGLFDDGVTIANAKTILSGDWSVLTNDTTPGRFRPVYWLYYAALYVLFGAHPFPFFLANTLLFLGAVGYLIYLLRQLNAGWLGAAAGGVIFALSGPVIENYYTLSKSEALQVLLILLALRLALTGAPTSKRMWAAHVASFLFLLGAMLSKETSLAVLPVFLISYLLTLLPRRQDSPSISCRSALALLLSAALAAALFWVWRSFHLQGIIKAGSYTEHYAALTLDTLRASAVQWLEWLRQDFAWLLPLALLMIVVMLVGRRFPAHPASYLVALTWMACWLVVFLPWNFKLSYYLLPFSAGAAVFAGLVLDGAWSALRQVKLPSRLVTLGAAGLFFLAFVDSFPIFVSNARYQLVTDAANTQLINFLARQAPQGGTVFVNLPAYNEYVYEIELHLHHIAGRPDLMIDRFYFQRPTPQQPAVDALIVAPFSENKPPLSLRFAFHGGDAQAWWETLQRFLAPAVEQPVIFADERTLATMHLLRLVCPVLPSTSFCQPDSSLFEKTTFRYGWRVLSYQVSTDQVSWPGVFDEGLWTLMLSDGSLRQVNFGQAGDQPLTGDFNSDRRTDLAVVRGQDWLIDLDQDGQADLSFSWAQQQPGDYPLASAAARDGSFQLFLYRPSDSLWWQRSGGDSEGEERMVVRTGSPNDQPLLGDWDGDQIATFGIYRPESGEVNLENQLGADLAGVDFTLPAGARLVVGDWFGRGRDSLAYLDGDAWRLLPASCGCKLPNDPKPLTLPVGEGIPVSGKWQ